MRRISQILGFLVLVACGTKDSPKVGETSALEPSVSETPASPPSDAQADTDARPSVVANNEVELRVLGMT